MNAIDKLSLPFPFGANHLHIFHYKGAHFFACFVLGLLDMNTLRKSRGISFRQVLLAFGICILYTMSDEIPSLHSRKGKCWMCCLMLLDLLVVIGIFIVLKMSDVKSNDEFSLNYQMEVV